MPSEPPNAATVYGPDTPEQARLERYGYLTCHRCRKIGREYELRRVAVHPKERSCDHQQGCALLALETARGR